MCIAFDPVLIEAAGAIMACATPQPAAEKRKKVGVRRAARRGARGVGVRFRLWCLRL